MAVLLGVRSDLAVVLVDEDAHLRQQLHLLLVQVICGYFRHSEGRVQASRVTAAHRRRSRQQLTVGIHIKVCTFNKTHSGKEVTIVSWCAVSLLNIFPCCFNKVFLNYNVGNSLSMSFFSSAL